MPPQIHRLNDICCAVYRITSAIALALLLGWATHWVLWSAFPAVIILAGALIATRIDFEETTEYLRGY